MTFEPTVEQLILYMRDRLEPDLHEQIQRHLAGGCLACQAQLRWLTPLVDAAQSGPPEPLPAVMRAAAQRIFADHRRRAAETNRSILHAILTFDSAWIPLPAGARAPASGQRRLLFAAEPYEVDLEITRMRRGSFDLLGQILPSRGLPPASQVTLQRRGRRVSELDNRGLFTFDAVAPGVVGLTFHLGDQIVKLSGVRIG